MADLVKQDESDDEKVAIVACFTIMSAALQIIISPKLGKSVIIVGFGVTYGIVAIKDLITVS